ncbi:hypothetical protein RN001_002348 [Aquatica leii]|uniref:Uncharacterized protein n=1 Tax=Aquatica leii TaxID=1421715 RepID=A0AAN7PGX1_9COLE|nr:hypothetical protein RN001_002348 [Aquatica leii]
MKKSIILLSSNKCEKLIVKSEAAGLYKKTNIQTLNNINADLSEKERLLRSVTCELTGVRAALEAVEKMKDNALQENRSLQDCLTSVTADNRNTHKEIDQYKRQIEDLKRQLQTYVAEVKRFEDIISHKEIERSQLLDQFKSLSEEASALESNNHTLEHEATQSKVQLSVTLDHVTDLETKLSNQRTLISDYETQITDLRLKLLKLEDELKCYRQQQDQTNNEMCYLKDLCTKLDNQKDNLVRELKVKDEEKIKISQDIVKFRHESDTLQSSLARDRASLENLEKLLVEAREEATQLKVYNEELEQEIKALNEKIGEFQNKLIETTEQLNFYQERASDYSQQNKHLRREIANERFSRVTETEKEGIDNESFELLDDETIAQIFPKAGPRLLFKKKYNEYKQKNKILVPMNVLPVLPSPSSSYSPSHTSSSSKCTTENIEIEFTDQDWVDVYNTPVCSNFIPEISQDPKRKTSDTSTEPIPTKKFINMCDIFEGGIESILQNTIDGKIVLLHKFRLNNDCRQRLVKEIINFLIGKVGIDGVKTYMLDYCAEKIPKIFPNEVKETYYIPYAPKSPHHNIKQAAKGKLWSRFVNVRNALRTAENTNKAANKENIELDFNTRFVTYEDKIYSRLSILTNAVIAEANLRKITVITDEDVDLTSKVILTLPYLLAPVTLKNKRKSGNWRPSRSEISESFFLHIENFEELQQKKSDRLEKLKSCSLTLQPFGVICGPLNNAKYLAVVNDVIYTFQSLIRTIEILYKTFHALDIQYPHECQHIWQLIEEIVFEMKHSPSSSSVTALISDLKKFICKGCKANQGFI